MYDWDFFDDMPEYHPIADANNLFDGFAAVRKGSGWKVEVQRLRWNWSVEIGKLQNELIAFQHDEPGGYKLMPYSKFELYERGTPRAITALRARDRIVKHVLNDLYLIPHIRPRLIYDNGASLKYKGVDFTRRRLIAHLQKYYREHGTNDGYILLTDFSGYYDNIDHALALRMLRKYEPDAFAQKLIKQAFDSFAVDVSYMTDAEYEAAKVTKFRVLDYRKAGHTDECRGEKLLHKSLSVGDLTSQITAIAFPTGIDKLIKTVLGQKYYARYMDDTYTIGQDKKVLRNVADAFMTAAKRYKLFVNPRKTKICKIGKTFTFLQYRYRLAENGHVIVRIGKKTLTRMRRKLKKLAVMVSNGIRPLSKAEDLFRSWLCNYRKVMSKQQVNNMVWLYRCLFGVGLDPWLESRNLL